MSRLTDEELAGRLYEAWCVEARKQIAITQPTFNLALVEAGLRPWSEVKDTYAREGWLAVARETRAADLTDADRKALQAMRSYLIDGEVPSARDEGNFLGLTTRLLESKP